MNSFPTQHPVSHQPLLLQGMPLQEIYSAAQLRRTVSRDLTDHRIRVCETGPLHFRYLKKHLHNLSVHYIEYGTDTTVEIERLTNAYAIQVPCSGQVHLKHGKQALDSDKRCTTVLSVSQPSRMDIAANSCLKVVRVSRASIETCLENLLQRQVVVPLEFDVAMATGSGAGSTWWRLLDQLEQEMQQPHSATSCLPVLKQMEQTVITSLLYGQPHNYSDALLRGEPDICPGHERKAETFIHNHVKESISLVDIVAAAGVPERTLYNGFQRFKGISPKKYLREVRFKGVRNQLQKSDGQGSITGIALEWGFQHLGHFSLEYKKRFGESPSTTLRR